MALEPSPPINVVALCDGTVDLGRGRVVRGAEATPLTTRESALLGYLAARPGQTVSREQLQIEVWGYSASVVSRTVDTTVRRLRTKIEADPANPAHLQTVHGRGYRFRPVPVADGDRVGREAELAAIAAALVEHPRVVVVGAAGVGKSRLLRDLVAEIRARVVWVDAAGAADPAALALRVARAAGISVADDPVREVGRALARRAELWALDGVEPAALSAIAGWAARLVVSCRERRALPGVAWVEIEPLPLPDAVTLFLARARQADPALATPGHAPPLALVRAVVDGLDRLPQAIEAAAARAHALPPAALVARLDDPELAAETPVGRAVRAAWDELPADARAVLTACAGFEGVFPLQAAQAAADLPPARAAEALADLRDRCLVLAVRDAPDGELGYRLLRPVRTLARGTGVQAAAAGARRRGWLRRAGEDAVAALDGPGAAAAMAGLRRMRADLEVAVGEDPADAALAIAFDAALELDRPAADRAGALARALASTDDAARRVALLVRSSNALRTSGRQREARRVAEEAVALAEAGDRGALAAALVAAAQVADRDEAGALAQRALAEQPAPAVAVQAWLVIARSGRGVDAVGRERALRRALEGVRAAPVPRLEGPVLVNLANARREAGRLAEAEALYRRAVAAGEAHGQARVEAAALLNLGGLLAERGDLAGGLLRLHEAVAAGRRAGEAVLVAHALHSVGHLLHRLGELGEAEVAYVEAVGLLRDADPALAASALGDLGALLADLDRVDEAELTLCEAEQGVAEADRVVLEVHRAHLDLARARSAGAEGGPWRRRAEARLQAAGASGAPRATMALRLAHERLADAGAASGARGTG